MGLDGSFRRRERAVNVDVVGVGDVDESRDPGSLRRIDELLLPVLIHRADRVTRLAREGGGRGGDHGGSAPTRGVERRAILHVPLDEGRAQALELFDLQRVGCRARQRPHRLTGLPQLPTDLTTQKSCSADDEIHLSPKESKAGSRRVARGLAPP